MGKFEEVFAINVNGKTEKKGNLTYLSWAWAWAEFKKVYPDATYKINQFDGTFCSGNEKMGYMVNTTVTAGELTYEMWLPIMDMRNNTILQPKMTEVNKTIMRCLAKNLAMFGLGLYIYAGEDLPESEESEPQHIDVKPIKTPQNKPVNEAKTDDNAKSFVPITKEEMLRKYGERHVEEWIVWAEGKFGKEFANWGEDECEMARLKLQERKEKREAAERKQRDLERLDDADLPFSVRG